MNIENEIINRKNKISDIVLNNHFLILVLERFGVELGQQDKTIETVCNEKNIGIEIFLIITNLYNNALYISSRLLNFSEIKTIIQYLKNSHQYYSEEVFPDILSNIQLLAKYNTTPGILMVESFFNQYKKEVDKHFSYENDIAFPYILNLLEKGKAENINYSVTEYKEHHDDIEEKLGDLKRLLIQHLQQKNDRIIRRKILFSLFDLELDLKIHAKIENEILIPFIEKVENQKQIS